MAGCWGYLKVEPAGCPARSHVGGKGKRKKGFSGAEPRKEGVAVLSEEERAGRVCLGGKGRGLFGRVVPQIPVTHRRDGAGQFDAGIGVWERDQG